MIKTLGRKRVRADSAQKKTTVAKKKVFGAPKLAQTVTGFPERMRMRHRYCETITISPTGGAGGLYIFSANGMYDPNITGTGHQPLYFDQMTPMYNHYAVISSKINVTLVSHTNVASTFSLLAVLLRLDQASFTGSVQNAVEQPTSVWKCYSANDEGLPATPTLYQSFNAYKVFGANVLDRDDVGGTGSANPTEQQYYAILCRDPLGVGNGVIDVNVVIEYDAVWTERVPIAQS